MAKLKKVNVGLSDPDVKDALRFISDNEIEHATNVLIWNIIQDLFKTQFSVSDPTGERVISSKLLLQILWKVVNKMKIPDFKIHKAGPFSLQKDMAKLAMENQGRDWTEQIVTAAVGTVLKEGKFPQCMRDKSGAFYKAALYGDAHVQIGFDEDNSDYPIAFRVNSLSDFYVTNTATDIRDVVGGLSADGTVEIFRYTKKQFDNLWPEFKDKVASGQIPRNYNDKQLEKTWQQSFTDQDLIEVGYYTSIDKVQVVFAGPACTVLRKYKGKAKDDKIQEAGKVTSYPYILDGKPYLPTLHFKFFPSSEGYYNYGIGHMIFDIAYLTVKMDRLAYRHAVDNVYPINFVNSPLKSSSKLFNDILKAHEMRDAGGSAYVISDNAQARSGITVEPFQSAPITNEWERAFMRLEQQITRMGFRLDAPDLGANPNEMSIMAEQESTDAPIKQIIEYNASEFEMAVNITMDFIRKFIADDDETPLNSTTEIEMGGTKIPLRGIPLGWVAKELRANKYFTVVNSRDGTVPSGIMEDAKLSRVQSTLQPGTPAWNKVNLMRSKVHGVELTEADMQVPQMAGGTAGAPVAEPLPTETTPVSASQLKHPVKL